MAEFRLLINDETFTVDVEPEMPLLWVLRDILGMTGTKYSCGKGLCGACTVHIDGEPAASCRRSVQSLQGRSITTIEGLAPATAEPLRRAWEAEHVSQCGYCQPGQIMTAAALLAHNPTPTNAEIESAMSDVICRCGTYPRIKRAIRRVIEEGGAS